MTIELDDGPETELTGYLQNVTEELLLIQPISSDGRSDGYAVVPPDQVNEVWWGDANLLAVARLAASRSTRVQVALG